MLDFKIHTSTNGPLSAEQLAEMAADEIVSVSDTAPAPIRDQAHVFKKAVRDTVLKYVQRGIDSHLMYMIKQGK
jgi:elongation factor P hydroxylase